MYFFTTHGFTSAKLRFLRDTDFVFEVFGAHFLVYFRTCFFKVLQSNFRNLWFCLSKTEDCGSRTFHVHMKNLICCLKTELQTKHPKNTFFELIFRNLWCRLSQTEVFRGLCSQKSNSKNMFFFVCFFFTSYGCFFPSTISHKFMILRNLWFRHSKTEVFSQL